MKKKEIFWLETNILNANICPMHTHWFLFGSILQKHTTSSDLDILIIYSDNEDVNIIRERICELELERPLDIIFMTHSEQEETEFIAATKCVEIFPKNRLYDLI